MSDAIRNRPPRPYAAVVAPGGARCAPVPPRARAVALSAAVPGGLPRPAAVMGTARAGLPATARWASPGAALGAPRPAAPTGPAAGPEAAMAAPAGRAEPPALPPPGPAAAPVPQAGRPSPPRPGAAARRIRARAAAGPSASAGADQASALEPRGGARSLEGARRGSMHLARSSASRAEAADAASPAMSSPAVLSPSELRSPTSPGETAALRDMVDFGDGLRKNLFLLVRRCLNEASIFAMMADGRAQQAEAKDALRAWRTADLRDLVRTCLVLEGRAPNAVTDADVDAAQLNRHFTGLVAAALLLAPSRAEGQALCARAAQAMQPGLGIEARAWVLLTVLAWHLSPADARGECDDVLARTAALREACPGRARTPGQSCAASDVEDAAPEQLQTVRRHYRRALTERLVAGRAKLPPQPAVARCGEAPVALQPDDWHVDAEPPRRGWRFFGLGRS